MSRRNKQLDLDADEYKGNVAPLPLKLDTTRHHQQAKGKKKAQKPTAEPQRLTDAEQALYDRNAQASRAVSGQSLEEDLSTSDSDDHAEEQPAPTGSHPSSTHQHSQLFDSSHLVHSVLTTNNERVYPPDFRLDPNFHHEIKPPVDPLQHTDDHVDTTLKEPTLSHQTSLPTSGRVLSRMPHRLSPQHRNIIGQKNYILARALSDGRFIKIPTNPTTYHRSYHLLNHYYKFKDVRKSQYLLIRDLIKTKKVLQPTLNTLSLVEQQQRQFKQRLHRLSRLSDETINVMHADGYFHDISHDYRQKGALIPELGQARRNLQSPYSPILKPSLSQYGISSQNKDQTPQKQLGYKRRENGELNGAVGYHSYENLTRHRLSADKKNLDIHQLYDDAKYNNNDNDMVIDDDVIDEDVYNQNHLSQSQKRKNQLKAFLSSTAQFSLNPSNIANQTRQTEIIRQLIGKNPNTYSRKLQQTGLLLNPFDIRLRINDFKENIRAIAQMTKGSKKIKTNDRSVVVLPPKKTRHQYVQRYIMERNMADPRLHCRKFLQSLLNCRNDLKKISKVAIYNAESSRLTSALALFKLQSQQQSYRHQDKLYRNMGGYSIDTVKRNKKGLMISPITNSMLLKAKQKLVHVTPEQKNYRDNIPIIDFFFANHWDDYTYQPCGREPVLYSHEQAMERNIDLSHQYRPQTKPSDSVRHNDPRQESFPARFLKAIKGKLFGPSAQSVVRNEPQHRTLPPRRYTGHNIPPAAGDDHIIHA